MTDNQKFFTGLAIGAAAGAAIALLLSSDKGKDILGNIKEFASKGSDSVKDGLSSLKDEVSDLWNKGKDKAQQQANAHLQNG